MRDEKITVAVFTPDGKIEKREIIDKLETFQELVGGYIEAVSFDKRLSERNIVCYANDEAKILKLDPSFYIFDGRDFVCGNVVFVKGDNEGGNISIDEYDFFKIIQALATGEMSPNEKERAKAVLENYF